MARRARVPRLLAILLLMPFGAGLAAHDVVADPNVELTATLRGDRLQVDVRLPAAAIADANVRQDAEGRIVAVDADAALAIIGRGIAADLAIEQEGDPLVPVETIATRAPDSMAARIALTYRIRGDGQGLSIRLRGFPAGNRTIRTRAIYVSNRTRPRTFLIGGAAERIVFEPRPLQTGRRFALAGTDALLGGEDVLLFVLCLTVPARRSNALQRAIVGLLAAQCAVILWATSPLAPVAMTSPVAILLATTIAASAMVLLAGQNLVNANSRGLPWFALIFGAAAGAGLARGFLDQAAHSGGFRAVALTAFLGVLLLEQVWIVVFVASLRGLLRRWSVSARLIPMAVSIFAAHAALHRLSTAGAQLAGSDSAILDRWLVVLALSWAVAILAAGSVDALWSGDSSPAPSDPPAGGLLDTSR